MSTHEGERTYLCLVLYHENAAGFHKDVGAVDDEECKRIREARMQRRLLLEDDGWKNAFQDKFRSSFIPFTAMCRNVLVHCLCSYPKIIYDEVRETIVQIFVINENEITPNTSDCSKSRIVRIPITGRISVYNQWRSISTVELANLVQTLP